MSDGKFKSGDEWTGNRNGRPKGGKNRKTLLREELERDGSALAAAIKQKALEGDTSAQALWLARLEPALRPRGESIEIELDTSAPLAKQLEQITRAVANGELTLDEGTQFADMIRQLAEVRKLENGGDDKADKLIEAFKTMAQNLPV